MVNIILISHGAFCEGLLASLQMIAGGDYGVRAVPLIPGESPEAYREKLETVMRGKPMTAAVQEPSFCLILQVVHLSRVPHIFQRISNSGLFPV
ncbi:MAG: hypothetical protein ACLTDX_17980 [[Clostridium] innocuum]